MTKRTTGARADSGEASASGKSAGKPARKKTSAPPAKSPGKKEPPLPESSAPETHKHHARVIAIANQKGGVGKSTTAVSLGAALADLGKRVLVVDLDPQGNASTGMGIKHEARNVTVYDVLANDAPVEQAIVQTPVARLDAIPSTIDLAGAEIELVSQFSRELRLRKALDPLRDDGARGYDFIFLDCPPSLGLLTVNALAAAEELIVPIQCEYYALEGLGQLLHNVKLVQQNINTGLRLTGIIMTMFDSRTKLSEQVVAEVKRYFGARVYDVVIPRTVRLSEAPGFGQPITVYDPKSRGAETYRALAKEVAERPIPEGEAMPTYDEMPTVMGQEEARPEKDAPPARDSAPEPAPARTEEPPPQRERPVQAAAEQKPAEGEGGDDELDDLVGSLVDSVTDEAQDEDEPAPALPPKQRPAPRPETSSAAAESPEPKQPAKARTPTPPPPAAKQAPKTPAPPRAPEKTRPAERPPAAAPGRRVVVIDERAEEAAVQSGREAPPRTQESDAGANAQVGETLPQDSKRRKKWWQFGKGGQG